MDEFFLSPALPVTRRALAMATACLIACAAGCETPPWRAKPGVEKSNPAEVRIDDREFDPAAEASSNSRPLPAQAENRLPNWWTDAWVAVVDDPLAEEPPRERWRHTELDAVLELPPDEQPDWRAEIQSSDRIRSLNAAIASARRGDAAGLPRLMATIRDSQLVPPPRRAELQGLGRAPSVVAAPRQAAVEALGRLPADAARPAIEDLLNEYGRFDGKSAARYIPELHAELLRAWSIHVVDRDEPLRAALASPSPLTRRAAIQGYAAGERINLPPEIIDAAADPDVSVRLSALRVLAAVRHPAAFEIACAALQDAELAMKIGAIAALGKLGGEQARDVVEPYRRDRGEAVRAAATIALVRLGDPTAGETALNDASWKVRRALADTLVENHDLRLATRLMADKSNEVRTRMITVMARWPWETAAPLLITALESERPQIRLDAARQIRGRWSAAAGLIATASQKRMKQQAQDLRKKFEAELAAAKFEYGRVDRAIDAQRESLEHELKQTLERTTAATVKPFVLHGEPCRCDATEWRRCATRLRSPDSIERRASLLDFRKWLGDKACEAELLAELGQLLENEQDVPVWLAALTILAEQSDPRVGMILAAASSHLSPEVRRRSLEWFATHPGMAHSDLLMNSLYDDHVAVVQAALAALAALPELRDGKPIEELLAARDPAIRLAAAYALAAHGIDPGYASLIRLSYHDDPAVRRKAAISLGELGDIRALDDLVRLLDDRPEVRLAALAALKGLSGFDAADSDLHRLAAGIESRPSVTGEFPRQLTANEQARCWKCWYEQKRR